MIDYQNLIDKAVLGVIKQVLKKFSDDQDKNICLYITFDTKAKMVKLSEKVRQQYPDFITIILENQFENLKVSSKYFTVDVSFFGQFETIRVPYQAITNFVDKIANFSLELKHEMYDGNDMEMMSYLHPNKKLKTGERHLNLAEVVDLQAYRSKNTHE